MRVTEGLSVVGVAIFLAATLVSGALGATKLGAGAINSAQPASSTRASSGLDPLVVKTQILLDRSHFSPGEIDGKDGENLEKALTAFAAAHEQQWNGKWSGELWQELNQNAPTDLLKQYIITDADVRGPFLSRIPSKMEQMSHLRALSYTSAREELAERFHVSEELLATLNPNTHFDKAGETIVVPRVGDTPIQPVARIVVDKAGQTVKAFDRQNHLLAFYPATVGSEEKPAPSGELKVTFIKRNPTYHYNPNYHFKGVKTNRPFTIKPGPNNPVGVVWIGLSKKGYGIHGTPDPAKVSKTQSHGCVRLTNWDAMQLAGVVKKGTPVEFVGESESTQTDKGDREATETATTSRRHH